MQVIDSVCKKCFLPPLMSLKATFPNLPVWIKFHFCRKKTLWMSLHCVNQINNQRFWIHFRLSIASKQAPRVDALGSYFGNELVLIGRQRCRGGSDVHVSPISFWEITGAYPSAGCVISGLGHGTNHLKGGKVKKKHSLMWFCILCPWKMGVTLSLWVVVLSVGQADYYCICEGSLSPSQNVT